MSRVKIGVVVAAVVTALTATAHVLTTSSLESRIVKDVEARVEKAEQLLIQTASFEGLGLMKRAETLARDPRLSKALDEQQDVTRSGVANEAFKSFMGELKQGEPKPDFLALVNDKGDVAAMLDVPRPDPEPWKSKFAAVAAALEKRQVSKDIWEYRTGVMKVGVAPVYDATSGSVKGALVLAYALNSKEAHTQAGLLGMDVAYFFGNRVRATSFRRGGAEEDMTRQQELAKPLFDSGLARDALEKGQIKLMRFKMAGEEYIGTAARLELNFADKTSGAMVMKSLTQALEPIGAVKTTIILLGFGALLTAILAMLVTARLILNPAEEVELGVTEIINGNIDYVFKPVGADLDGLANALNVMLARLLGRPEPGEEQFDENGNIATNTSKVLLDDEAGSAGAAAALGGSAINDPDTLALAQEPEVDYYRRIYGEYVDARKVLGEKSDGVTFDGFIVKLRLNEGTLKKKYNCKAVRFRVQTKNGQVTLKPIPIV
ncbi:MAG: hypothetical protein HY698_03605 [Deltaproteobacteria bacterium]|nr:hypothetical protein [Deltaproteobacteria bacterium]